MKRIQAGTKYYKELNEDIKKCRDKEIIIYDLHGQRYIGAGLTDTKLMLEGIPGNDLGCFLNGSEITVLASAQDATGDTMNDGRIIIHGSAGDACGYAMRGGSIYIRDKAGYRAGIHMKAYKEKQPLIIIGDSAGSFLGEYQAGGTIIVLGLEQGGKPPVGNFCGTGMHGGQIILRADTLPPDLPAQVAASDATPEDLEDIREKIEEFCQIFSLDIDFVMKQHFFVLKPNSANPYKQLYTHI